jgi:phosphate transport system substrate-binding protein
VNIPNIEEGAFMLTPPILARIFLGNITKWNDPILLALNPGLALPNVDITLIIRGDSVTLNSVLHAGLSFVSEEWKNKVQLGSDGLTIKWPYTTKLIERDDFFSHGTAMATVGIPLLPSFDSFID